MVISIIAAIVVVIIIIIVVVIIISGVISNCFTPRPTIIMTGGRDLQADAGLAGRTVRPSVIIAGIMIIATGNGERRPATRSPTLSLFSVITR